MVVHVACMGKTTNTYKVLVGRLEGIRRLKRHKRRWEDSIRNVCLLITDLKR